MNKLKRHTQTHSRETEEIGQMTNRYIEILTAYSHLRSCINSTSDVSPQVHTMDIFPW